MNCPAAMLSDEADFTEICLRHLDGALTAEQTAAFNHRLATEPAACVHFLDLCAQHALLDDEHYLATRAVADFPAFSHEPLHAPASRAIRFRWEPFAAAAALVILASAVVLWWSEPDASDTTALPPAWPLMTTPVLAPVTAAAPVEAEPRTLFFYPYEGFPGVPGVWSPSAFPTMTNVLKYSGFFSSEPVWPESLPSTETRAHEALLLHVASLSVYEPDPRLISIASRLGAWSTVDL